MGTCFNTCLWERYNRLWGCSCQAVPLCHHSIIPPSRNCTNTTVPKR